MKKTFNWFRKIAFAEGVSFIVLLFIAMPLKHFAGMPLAVTIAGGLHGFLFVAFVIMAREVKVDAKNAPIAIGWKWLGKALLASFLPFGTFVMDKEWKKEEAALA